MSGEFSMAPAEAVVERVRNRLREAAVLDRIRVAVASARLPDWAFGGLEQTTRWRDLVGASFQECERELLRLRDALQDSASAALDTDDGAGSGERSLPKTTDPLAPMAVANPKAAVVDHVVELPGWGEATYRYTDVDGCGFDVPAPGLPPVRVGIVTEAAFHDFRIGTESDDYLECALARHGHQLEEAELVGRAVGSQLRVLGEYIIPLWLSSPDAIGVAAERLSDALGEFETEFVSHADNVSTVSHDRVDLRSPGSNLYRVNEDYNGARRRLSELIGLLELVATDLKRARNRCAAIIVEHQAAIVTARERVLRGSTGQGDDDSADPNPTSVLLAGYESAVLAMNDVIATTVFRDWAGPNPSPPGPVGFDRR